MTLGIGRCGRGILNVLGSLGCDHDLELLINEASLQHLELKLVDLGAGCFRKHRKENAWAFRTLCNESHSWALSFFSDTISDRA